MLKSKMDQLEQIIGEEIYGLTLEGINPINRKWLEVLVEDENFSPEDFVQTLIKEDGSWGMAIFLYRNKMLRARKNKAVDLAITADNLQNLFLEYIGKNELKFIDKKVKSGISLNEVYMNCCKQGKRCMYYFL